MMIIKTSQIWLFPLLLKFLQAVYPLTATTVAGAWLHPGPQGTEQAGPASLLSSKALICQRSVKSCMGLLG